MYTTVENYVCQYIYLYLKYVRYACALEAESVVNSENITLPGVPGMK